MLIHCSLLPNFAVCESYNPEICQNGGIGRTFTHTKIQKYPCLQLSFYTVKQALNADDIIIDFDPPQKKVLP